jgi:hypothetical protein
VRVVVEVPPGGFTAFNLAPAGPAKEARKLIVLGALPIHGFTSTGDVPFWPPQLNIDFWTTGDPVDPTPEIGGLVWWVNSGVGLQAFQTFAPDVAAHTILLADRSPLFEDAHTIGAECGAAEVITASPEAGEWRDLPTILYGAIVRLQAAVVPDARISAPAMWSPVQGKEAATFSMDDWVGAAASGDITPAFHVRPKGPVSADLLVRPNQMLLAHARGQVPDLDLTYVPADPEEETAALARRVLDLRWRRSMLAYLGELGDAHGADALQIALTDLVQVAGRELAGLMETAITTARNSGEGQVAMAALIEADLPWRPDLVIPQLIPPVRRRVSCSPAAPPTSAVRTARSSYKPSSTPTIRTPPTCSTSWPTRPAETCRYRYPRRPSSRRPLTLSRARLAPRPHG